MKQELRIFLAAIQYFTRIPVPAWVGHAPDRLAQAARYLPMTGMLVGAVAAAVLWLGALVLPLPLAVGLSMAAGILITGAFHEDGLSDYADGLGAADKEKILAIMKDARTGVYGVIALVLVLLLKHQALVALGGRRAMLYVAASLIAAHALSRTMAVSIMLTQRYVRVDDSARAHHAAQPLSYGSFAFALLTSMAALGLLLAAGARPQSIVAALAAAVLMRAYLAWRFQQRLGGYTGDCLGAVQQLTELVFYLGLLVAI